MTDLTAATEATSRWPTPELRTPLPDWAKEGLEEVYTALFAAATHPQCEDLTGCPHCGYQAERALALFIPFVEAREAQAAVKALREFARNQDTWCEAGRAEQIISRAAMRDALNREADRIERGES